MSDRLTDLCEQYEGEGGDACREILRLEDEVMRLEAGPADDNMALWDSVCTSDPATLKHVGQRGGFTAIDAQSQIKKATEMWGAYGTGWGVRDLDYHYLRKDDTVVGLGLVGVFYYPGDDVQGSFPVGVDCAYSPRDDGYKKLLTDLTTKALAKLGFNSDVFEGAFDDNKYVGKGAGGKEKPPEASEGGGDEPVI